MTFLKAIVASVLFASISASAAKFDCTAISQNIGGRVQLISRGGNESGLSFLLVKNNVTVGRLDFPAPPTTVTRQNLEGQEVPFLKFFESLSAGSVVVTSTLLVEQSLLKGQSEQGLVTLQQQNLEQFLCRPATK
jgi:hypothetical protein